MANAFIGEVLHFGAVRMRVNGSGNLKLSLFSLDEVIEDVLEPIEMASATNTEPTQLANLTEQRAYLQFQTTEINETFTISRIVIFIRPTATGYPQ